MRTIALVFARGGSKGIPRKNLRELAGHPLLYYSIRAGQVTTEVDGVFVSTEDAEIAGVAESLGAEVIHRPSELATDTSAEWDAWRHAAKTLMQRLGEDFRFVSLPPTSPLRRTEDVTRCLDALTPEVDLVVTATTAHRNPWFNMIQRDERGVVGTVLNPPNPISRRQDAPEVFDLGTVAYVTRASHIIEADGLWDGRVSAVIVPPETAVDIDSEIDLMFAQLLIANSESQEPTGHV